MSNKAKGVLQLFILMLMILGACDFARAEMAMPVIGILLVGCVAAFLVEIA